MKMYNGCCQALANGHGAAQHISTCYVFPVVSRQGSNEMCMVCYTDPISAEPAIQLRCGHTFHLDCCRRLLKKRWVGPRVTFGFMLCPVCKSPMENPALNDLLDPIKKLKEVITQKALTRLQYEGRQNSEAITKPGGTFYRDAGAYALELYAYYMCHKCGKPYFGGESRCEDQVAGVVDHKPEELVCGLCSNVFSDKVCTKHGEDYFGYKCRYCCSVAVFFCFGTTHFCNSCHNDSGRLGRISQGSLPKCPVGPKATQLPLGGECPLRVKHPPTGEEFRLGCAICLNTLTF